MIEGELIIVFLERQNITQKVGNNRLKRDKIYVQTGDNYEMD